MQKVDVAKGLKTIKSFAVKHTPEILTGVGIAGMFTMGVLAVKETPKALKAIDAEKKRLSEELGEPVDNLTPVETVKVTWKYYVPAAVTGVISAGCLIGASSTNLRRNAALATAYKLSETALSEYKDKVIETMGERKEKTVREKVAQEQIKKNPVTNTEVIVTEQGNSRFHDPMSGRHFTSTIDKIKKAENNLNNTMLHDITGYATLNEFYDEIGLPHTDVGDNFGWNTTNLVKIDFYPILEEDGTATIVLDYINRPDYDFDR